jgi:DNA-binding beta-propeller fold protein YncE
VTAAPPSPRGGLSSPPGCALQAPGASTSGRSSLDPTGLTDDLCARIYAVNNLSADGVSWTVSVIDPRAMTVVESIPVRPHPHHIHPVPGRNIAYISYLTSQHLNVLDMVSNSVVAHIHTGFGARHLASSPDGRLAFTDDFVGDTVTAIDTASGRILGRVRVGRHPNHSVPSADGRSLFVANSGESSVSVGNPADSTWSVVSLLGHRLVAELPGGATRSR